MTLALSLSAAYGSQADGEQALLPALAPAVTKAIKDFDSIPEDRRTLLAKAAGFVQAKAAAGQLSQLTFICTHNSRRSHLSQIWAQTAAAYYGLAHVQTFSGGTEATACNERTIAALKRAGFDISKATEGANPQYLVRFSPSAEPVRAYSKVYDAESNPKSDFLAAMTCDHADTNCPVVIGASVRVPLHYQDPKLSDGTPEESSTYNLRSHQIATEMFYFMALAAKPK